MIPIARPCFGPEEEQAAAEVLRSGWVAQGPTTAALEEEFARATGVPFAVAIYQGDVLQHYVRFQEYAVGLEPDESLFARPEGVTFETGS